MGKKNLYQIVDAYNNTITKNKALDLILDMKREDVIIPELIR